MAVDINIQPISLKPQLWMELIQNFHARPILQAEKCSSLWIILPSMVRTKFSFNCEKNTELLQKRLNKIAVSLNSTSPHKLTNQNSLPKKSYQIRTPKENKEPMPVWGVHRLGKTNVVRMTSNDQPHWDVLLDICIHILEDISVIWILSLSSKEKVLKRPCQEWLFVVITSTQTTWVSKIEHELSGFLFFYIGRGGRSPARRATTGFL